MRRYMSLGLSLLLILTLATAGCKDRSAGSDTKDTAAKEAASSPEASPAQTGREKIIVEKTDELPMAVKEGYIQATIGMLQSEDMVMEVNRTIPDLPGSFKLITSDSAYNLHTSPQTEWIGFEQGTSSSWKLRLSSRDRYRATGVVRGDAFQALRLEYLGRK